MFQRAAAAAVSSAILVGCLPPEEQHWVVREVVDVCAPFDPADFESTWRGERIEVEGDTEQAFRASFGGIAGDCSEPSGDLRTCSFDMPIVSTNRNGTETTTPCSFVVSVERDRFAPIGSDLGIAGPVDRDGVGARRSGCVRRSGRRRGRGQAERGAGV